MQVKVTVNERGALRNGRFAFTDRFTLVTELLQNGRRAGATQIWVMYDAQAKALTVEDDGSGIADFQKLLTINESGWDEATQQQEHAFGVGFSNVLYAAERCTVQSRGLSMVFSTDAALHQEPIDVVDDSTAHPYRTRVVLEGVDLPDLDKRMPELVRGFALPVTFNGVLMARPHSENGQADSACLSFTSTPVGLVYLHGRDSGEPANGTYVYLQGFCVHKPSWATHAAVHVVHLDAEQFIARLPDRRVLIDEDEQLRLVHAAQRGLWRSILCEAKCRLSPEQFCDRYWEVARAWHCGDVFDDVPALPKQVCAQITSYPIQASSAAEDYLEEVARPMTRREIEAGEVHLVDLSSPDETNMALWMAARHLGYVIVRTYGLSDQHWVHAHVRHLEEEDVDVTALGAGPTAMFEGRWIDARVQLCERVSIRLSGVSCVEIADEAVWDGQTLFVPQAEASGAGVRQVSNYVDCNDHFVEDYFEADCDALATLIARLRYTDPRDALRSCLGELDLHQLPLVCGRDYLVRIDQRGQIESVDLVETAVAVEAVRM